MAEKKKPEPKEEPKPKQLDDAPAGKTIDERMADLLADHKKMGAR
jgi:hypothetical protein